MLAEVTTPDGWAQSEKADTAPAWALPVPQINKGVHFLVLSDYCLFLMQDSLKIQTAREGKYTGEAGFIYLPICKSCCIDP